MSEEIHECRVERGTGRRCGLFIIIVTGCALTILAAPPPETDGLTKGVVWRQGFEGPDPSLVDWWGNIEKTVELQEIKTEDGRKVRWFDPRIGPFAFQGFDQSCFFATNVGSCSSMNSQIESFPLAEGIFSENSIRV